MKAKDETHLLELGRSSPGRIEEIFLDDKSAGFQLEAAKSALPMLWQFCL